jgi:hypothetical protein
VTDLEQFVNDTLAFVKRAVPDASIAKRTSAATEIVKEFKWLFDKEGNRVKLSERVRLKSLIEENLTGAQIRLQLGRYGVASWEELGIETMREIVAKIEARKGK